jgi:hypothetical protein
MLQSLSGLVAPVRAQFAPYHVFGGFGLQPAIVPGLLFIGYIISQYAVGMRYPGEGPALSAMIPLLALLFHAVLAARSNTTASSASTGSGVWLAHSRA